MATEAYKVPAWLRKWSRDQDTADDPSSVTVMDYMPESVRPKMRLIMIANEILKEYHEQGFQLTLRQLYYQFVARGFLENSNKNYKILGGAITDGRLWGILDWDHLVDRARVFQRRPHWSTPADIIRSAQSSFRLDRWANSSHRLEVWVEKQALEEIVERACEPYDVGYIACKGYMSISEMRAAAERLRINQDQGQEVVVIYLGDHDPSGMDMSRDIEDRLNLFNCPAEIKRIALNWDQVETYNPPPNPAKVTDSRANGYIDKFGYESWELDALEPSVLLELIEGTILDHIDDAYHDQETEEERHRELLGLCADNWENVTDHLGDLE